VDWGSFLGGSLAYVGSCVVASTSFWQNAQSKDTSDKLLKIEEAKSRVLFKINSSDEYNYTPERLRIAEEARAQSAIETEKYAKDSNFSDKDRKFWVRIAKEDKLKRVLRLELKGITLLSKKTSAASDYDQIDLFFTNFGVGEAETVEVLSFAYYRKNEGKPIGFSASMDCCKKNRFTSIFSKEAICPVFSDFQPDTQNLSIDETDFLIRESDGVRPVIDENGLIVPQVGCDKPLLFKLKLKIKNNIKTAIEECTLFAFADSDPCDSSNDYIREWKESKNSYVVSDAE
jgi:hypothetical protein